MIDFALLTYVAVMSVTPGPNNLLLATSGVHFGFRRTVPQVLGISFGHFLQVAVVTLAFSLAVASLAWVRLGLSVVGCLYLLVLSWQIFRAGTPDNPGARRPMRFYESVLFQWVNPKAWVMVINVAVLFVPSGTPAVRDAVRLAIFCALVNLPCVTLWAITGDRLRRILSQGSAAVVFNAGMGALMAATALWLLADELFKL